MKSNQKIKNYNLELRHKITEMKNLLEGFKGRFEQTEETISNLIGQLKLSTMRNRTKINGK